MPLHSGYSFRSQNILLAQRNLGWTPIVLTSPKHEQSLQQSRPDKEEVEGFVHYRTNLVPRRLLGVPSDARIMQALSHRLREVVEFERPDVLHAHSPILNAIPALRIGRRLHIPVIYEIRAFWEDAAVDHGTYGKLSWRYTAVKSIETWICRKADQVIVLCGGLRDDLVGRGISEQKLTTVYNGINPDDFRDPQPDLELQKSWNLAGRKAVGFIGSFYKYEGLNLLVTAMAELGKTRPNTVLILAGGGEMEGEIRAQVRKLNLDHRVILPGRIAHRRIPGVYALLDVLAYPRYSMRLTELVTPLKPLEAMAAGRPLVASDIGGHRELIRDGETGLLFPAGDLSRLVEALKYLLDNPDLGNRIAQAARTWVREKHSWQETTAPYRGVYKQALRN